MDGELKENLKKAAAEEGKKLSAMSFPEKLDYLWTYYKIWLLVAAVVIFFVYLLGNIIYKSTFDTVFGIGIINDSSSYGNERMEHWADELHDAAGLAPKEVIDVEYNISIDFELQDEMSYASMAKMSALVASKSIDVVLTDYSAAENYEKNLAFRNLREVLPEALYEKLDAEGRIISFTVPLDADGNPAEAEETASALDDLASTETGKETGAALEAEADEAEKADGAAVSTTTIPCMVKLDPVQLEKVSGITAEPMYFGVIANSEHDEMVQWFVDYLLGETA